jgi:hypothetical protein
MLAALTLGLTLWILYGVIQGDWSSCHLAGIVLRCKVRDLK